MCFVNFNLHGSTNIVKLKKALYGLVTASKLWYYRLTGVLINIGKPNDYDPCVFMDKSIHIGCYNDVFLVCYSGDDAIPESLMKRLICQFTDVKVDLLNSLVYLGMNIHLTNKKCVCIYTHSTDDYDQVIRIICYLSSIMRDIICCLL